MKSQIHKIHNCYVIHRIEVFLLDEVADNVILQRPGCPRAVGCVEESGDFLFHYPFSVQSLQRTSACSRTSSVARACLSGG